MKNAKKMMALALAASMVMGSSVVAFAAATTGGTQGSGAVEGHVDKEVLNVILPTVETGSSLFSYTMDPERLIQGTSAAKYAEGAVFPAAGSDTGVYFLTGTNTYANTSNAYQVINKSSCDVELTVKVKATAGTNDIALATSSTVASTGTTPELYLGLKVGEGSTPTVLDATEKPITKRISGSQSNFDVAVKTKEDNTKEYVYQAKEGADATGWKAMNISLEGAVSTMPITATTTAPTVDVTWEYKKADDNTPAANASEEVLYKVTGPQITVSASGLISVTNVTADKNFASVDITVPNGAKYDVNTNPITWDTSNWSSENGGSITGQLGSEWMTWLVTEGGNITLTLNLTDGTTATCTQTLSN